MATGRRTVAPGQTIASDWGNTAWDQTVQSFSSAADRATQFASPKAGATTWLDDVKRLETWDGTAWVEASYSRTYIATISAVTVPVGGILGWTGGVTIPAANYPRIALVSYSCLIISVTGGANTVSDVRIRKDGGDMVGGRARDSSFTISGVWVDTIAAGSAPQYQGVVTTIGSGSATTEADARFSFLHIITTPGVKQ